ncbi:DUF1249 domain-containing protein [uncultured Thiodictyon sp.]|uniref:DUF1249 domain-containing protein n=1 Tax=uncultured Thiodictyon sp. TaxID=1846217 RepID=UPI002600825D|nr:DUF1249 domain-containing protein [uncultured Thiodictyon sp.]
MQPTPRGPQDLLGLAFARPTVGDLMRLCEENFVLLRRLAPHLKDQREDLVSRRQGRVDLFLLIEEQSRYTSLIRLTHFFPGPQPLPAPGSAPLAAGNGDLTRQRADPNARLRIYHDARQVEVLDLRQTTLPLRTDYQRPALEAKWRVNLFLGKWLAYCLHQGHRFGPGGDPGTDQVPLPQGGDLIDILT